MDSSANLFDARGVAFKLDNGLAGLLQVKDAEDLVVAGGGQGCAVIAEVDALDDVFVLQRQLFFS